MAALLVRVAILASGLGVTEAGLLSALRSGDASGWAISLLVGVPLLIAGTAGIIHPLLRGGQP